MIAYAPLRLSSQPSHETLIYDVSYIKSSSMGKSKIQPLVPLVSRVRLVIQPLILSHSGPFPITIRISLHIVQFCSQVQEDIDYEEREENVVSPLIARCIVFPINICRDDSRRLDAHIIKSSGDCSRAYRIRISRVPTYLDWMS